MLLLYKSETEKDVSRGKGDNILPYVHLWDLHNELNHPRKFVLSFIPFLKKKNLTIGISHPTFHFPLEFLVPFLEGCGYFDPMLTLPAWNRSLLRYLFVKIKRFCISISGICYGFQVMLQVESPNTIFTILRPDFL